VSDPVDAGTAAADSGAQAALAAWREQGGHACDPVRFRFIESLARRAQTRQGATRQQLDRRLVALLSDYGTRVERARAEADALLADALRRFPHAADELRRCHAAGDPALLRRLAAFLEGQGRPPGALRELSGHLARLAPEGAGPTSSSDPAAETAPRTELKTLQRFRDTWSKLSVDQRLARSLAKSPESAGPLNSHALVLRSLQLMRDLSPEYLHRFMAHLDALLWLDGVHGGPALVPKDVVRTAGAERKPEGTERKRRSVRKKPADPG